MKEEIERRLEGDGERARETGRTRERTRHGET